MSEPFFRFGKNPGLSGIYGVPQIGGSIYYLAYRATSGREEVTHTYDPADGSWTVISDEHVQLTVEDDLFELRIDDTLALQLSDGVLAVEWLSERGNPVEASAVFYSRGGRTPLRLATLTQSGKLGVPTVTESDEFTGDTARFRLFNDSEVKAAIGKNGLWAASILEGIPV